ncbi:MAG: efflux RND transporter periplasmic adaptor subunit [Muribaculum sp.]|nr:efflux RND transporter periplasmic adaptor subunit [Muribaculum sp.]
MKKLKIKSTKLKVAVGAVSLLAIVAVGVIFIVKRGHRRIVQEEPVVGVTRALSDDVEIYGEYVGRVRASQFVEVRARVEGYLEKMLFEEGSQVQKGQVLFVINPDTYKARVDKARAQLKKDEAQAQKTARDLERIRPLYEQNAASQLDLDNAVAAYETANASVGMSKADLAQAELELSYTTVRSPIRGRISERMVDIGTLVGPGSKSLLATVVESDTVLIDFSMTALDYLKSKERNVELGERDDSRGWQPYVTITLADNTVYLHRGMVDFAEPQVDPNTGTFSVRARMPNPERSILPGQFTKVRVLLDVRENATVVPLKGVIIEKGGAYIYVVRQDSTVEKRFIELGPEIENRAVVERGLIAGETVVVEGQHKLTPGMKVRPEQEDFDGDSEPSEAIEPSANGNVVSNNE